MSNEEFRNQPSSYVVEPNQANYETGKLQKLNQKRLYTWLGVLTGLSVLSLGLVAWLAYWLKQTNDVLEQQTEALKATQAEVARYKVMETRISDLETQAKSLNQNLILLNQQVPKGLSNQIKAIEKNVSSLQKAGSKAVTQEQMAQGIQRALKGQNQTRSNSGTIFSVPVGR